MLNLSKRLAMLWMIALGVAVTSYGAAADAACPKVGFTIVEPKATPQTRPLKVGKDQTLFIRTQWLTTTTDIAEIKLERSEYGDEDDVLLQIKFTPAADQRLHDATTHRSGMRIAFLFDEEVLANVVWEGPYGMHTGGTQVSIRHGLNQAQRLMKAIEGCTAPGADQGSVIEAPSPASSK